LTPNHTNQSGHLPNWMLYPYNIGQLN
jgi:hypothetical protein